MSTESHQNGLPKPRGVSDAMSPSLLDIACAESPQEGNNALVCEG